MSKMKKLGIVILFLIFSNALYSQEIKVVQDFGVWTAIDIEKKFGENVRINLEQQLKLHTNATKLDDYIIDAGLRYKLNKNFSLGANLRYTYDQKRWRSPENNYRYNLDFIYSGKLTDKLTIGYRLRHQHEYIDLFRENSQHKRNCYGIRNKVQMKYKLNKKNEMFFAFELFRLIETYREPYFNKFRIYFGDEYKTKKFGKIALSFGYEQELNDTYPLSFYFVKTNYTFRL
jgi:hypothetical protein